MTELFTENQMRKSESGITKPGAMYFKLAHLTTEDIARQHQRNKDHDNFLAQVGDPPSGLSFR